MRTPSVALRERKSVDFSAGICYTVFYEAKHPERREELQEIGVEGFDKYLVTAGIPDPDLIVRTSGENRLSNYLLWQGAYSEFLFVDTLWPDFRKDEFRAALECYSKRDRRYGKVK